MNKEITKLEAEVTEKIIWKILDGLPQKTKEQILLDVLENIEE